MHIPFLCEKLHVLTRYYAYSIIVKKEEQMGYSPVLAQWKKILTREKNNGRDEFIVNRDVNEFIPVLTEWALKNDYEMIETEQEAIVLIKRNFGNMRIPANVLVVCFLSNPIRIHGIWVIGSKYENIINGDFKDTAKLNIGNMKPFYKQIEALVKALS